MTIRKKICLLGETSVGKTSLVSQYINSIFSENYLTTVGVKIDKKSMSINDNDLELLIWDIAGGSDANTYFKSYLKGSAGFLIVADVTKPQTFEYALKQIRFIQTLDTQPSMLVLLNKSDLEDQTQINDSHLVPLHEMSIDYKYTSAKLDLGVNESFEYIASRVLADS